MKNKGILTVGAGLIAVLLMFVGCGGQDGEKEFNKGMEAWESGDLVQARALFEKATGRLAGNANRSKAFNNLGLVLWQLDEPDAAAKAFSEACSLSEAITDARLNLAIAQYHAGDLDGARVSINMYLGEHPTNKTALATQSLIAAGRQDWAQSSRVMAEAAAVDPNDPAAQNALALAELNHGLSTAQVISRLKRVVSSHPDYAPALFNLAMIYDQWMSDSPTALSYYNNYLQTAGTSASHAAVAQQAVARLSGQAASSDRRAEATQYMEAGTKALSAKNYTQAVTQFEKAVQADPSLKNAYYNMGLAHYSLGQYDDAVQACRNALSLDSRFADARYMLALTYAQQKKWNDAEREARALSSIDADRGATIMKYINSVRN